MGIPALKNLLADSSPVAGHEVLNSSFLEVPKSALIMVVTALWALCSTKTDVSDSAADESLVAERKKTRADAGQILCDNVKYVTNPPMGLGSRHCSMIHKIHCLVHIMWMMLGSWSAVCAWAANVLFITTDQGTEANLADCPVVDLKQLFPWFREKVTQSQEGDEDLLADDDGELKPNGPLSFQRLFFRAVSIIGGLHLCHGCTGALTKGLEFFDEWLITFKALIEFFKNPGLRERFCKKCLNGRLLWLRARFKTFDADLTEWRWNSLIHAINTVSERRRAIVDNWDHHSMVEGSKVHRPANAGPRSVPNAAANDGNVRDDSADKVAKVTSAIMSLYMWAYAAMLHVLADIILVVSFWFESCPCHSSSAMGVKGVHISSNFKFNHEV